jgi:hypothetical protein
MRTAAKPVCGLLYIPRSRCPWAFSRKKRAVPKLDTPQRRRREQERQFKPLAKEIGWIAFEWNRLEEALAELFADAISDHQRALDFRLLRQSQRNVSRLWPMQFTSTPTSTAAECSRRSRAAVATARVYRQSARARRGFAGKPDAANARTDAGTHHGGKCRRPA